MASFIPSMALQHPNAPPPKPAHRPPQPPHPRRPHAARVLQRVQAAVRDDHLGLALTLLDDNPCLRLPDRVAEELAGKLRLRGVRAPSNPLGAQLGQPENSALQLLARDRRRDVLRSVNAAKLATAVAEFGRKGLLAEAFAAVETAPPEIVNAAALESLVDAAGVAGQMRKACYVIDTLFPRFGQQPSAAAHAHLVDACGRVGNIQRAITTMASDNFRRLDKPDQAYVFERLMYACVRCKALDQAERILNRMKHAHIPRTEQIYINLLSGSARDRPVDRSLHIVGLMRQDGFSPHVGTYNALILGCSRAGRLRDALAFYEIISASETMHPNLDTFNALLLCCARANDPDTAFEVLRKMTSEAGITPNAKSYNWVVVACARVADVDRAFQVARIMRRKGIRLNVVTNNNLLEACCNAGRLERAFALVKEMIERHGVSPNSHTYNTLIRGIGRWGQLDAALRMLTSMRTAGVSPTVVTYSVAVDACARAGGPVALDRAFELVSEMKESGLEPNLVTYNSLIHACARARNVDMAFTVLSQMRKDNIAPDIVTLCSLVDACGRASRVERAFDVIAKLPQEFPLLKPSVPVYNALIHACFKAEDVGKMKIALSDMKRLQLKPNIVTFSTLVSAYAAAGDITRALSVLEDMKAEGLSPNRMTFTSIIAGYGHQGKVELAMDALEEAKSSCGEPDEELYTAAIVAAISGGRVKLAVKLESEMNRAGYFVPTVLNKMMRKVGDVERSGKELRNMLEAMEALKIRPQRAALESLIAAYAKEADVAAAFAFIPEMERLGYPPNLATYKKLIQACAISGRESDIDRARSLFCKLRSRVRSGDSRLRSHHWVELYDAMIRAVDKVPREDRMDNLKISLLKSMVTDCGIQPAREVVKRVCPELLNVL